MAARKKVLIVEDEAELREILEFDFESAGYEVQTAQNATEAQEHLKNSLVNAIVSDIRMANGDGIQLLNSISPYKLEKNIAMVLITGFSDFTIQAALDQGADGFILKPFGRRKLVSAIERLLLPLEQRLSKKSPVNPTATPYKTTFKSFNTAVNEHGLSLGRGGVFIASSSSALKPEDAVQFDIQFEDGSFAPLVGDGTVRWVRKEKTPEGPAGFGLEFQYLEDRGLKEVKGYLEKNPILAYIPKS